MSDISTCCKGLETLSDREPILPDPEADDLNSFLIAGTLSCVSQIHVVRTKCRCECDLNCTINPDTVDGYNILNTTVSPYCGMTSKWNEEGIGLEAISDFFCLSPLHFPSQRENRM